jgi:putative transposase
MRGFKSPGHAQRFLSVHGIIQNFFKLGRHRLRPESYRLLRARSFEAWNVATGT